MDYLGVFLAHPVQHRPRGDVNGAKGMMTREIKVIMSRRRTLIKCGDRRC